MKTERMSATIQTSHQPDRFENRSAEVDVNDSRILIHPRMAWMMYYAQVKSVRKVCEKFGISRKTFYKWWNRYQQSGLNAKSLQDESRRPHRSPRATPQAVVERIVEAREETGYGQRRLKSYLETEHNIVLSEHTIWKLLRRHYGEDNGPMNRITGTNALKGKPGDRVEVFVFDLSSYAGQPAFLFTAVDLCTGIRISHVFEKYSARAATEFAQFIIEKFPFAIVEIQTPDDKVFTNGSPTTGVTSLLFVPFRFVLRDNNIRHIATENNSNGTNRKLVEEVDRVEYFEKHRFKTFDSFTAEFEEYINFYNNHRRSDSNKGLTPMQVLKTSAEFRHMAYFDPYA